ncbi:MAG: hypothetical protein H7066_14850 [Cytophagaceae bacterium]|nr:hypothetical protein [Gemmatimonadaceae bacterium]
MSTPINVPTLYAIGSVVAGYSHSCGLAQGVALCWGANVFGVLGVGSIGGVALQPTPVQAGGVAFVQLVSGGYHNCGLTAAGEAWCWGWNAEGQTGIGSVGSPVILPQRVQDGGLRFASLAAGESHTCGLTAAGVAYCWGGNARGELGSDPGVIGAQRPTPTMVPGVPALSLIDGGTLHSCALATTGEAWCWGDRTSGQTGDGVVDGAITSPHLVSGTMSWAHLATAGSTTCAVEAGTLDAWCWGRGDQGSLGNGAFPAHSALPVLAGSLLLQGPALTTPRVDVGPASGAPGSIVCATTTLGTVLCWGPGGRGQLGDGTLTPRRAVAAPVLVGPPTE